MRPGASISIVFLLGCHGDAALPDGHEPAVDVSDAVDAADAPTAIAPTLFGLSVRYNQAPWPTLAFATTRTLGPPEGTWGHLETSDGTYDWQYVDTFIA